MCEKDCCKKACDTHCWHYQSQQWYQTCLPYAQGGQNRRCCHCGKYESDLHGPYAPKYPVQPYITWTNPSWTITTTNTPITWYTPQYTGNIVISGNTSAALSTANVSCCMSGCTGNCGICTKKK